MRGQAVGVASPSPRHGSLFRLVRLSVFLEDVGSRQRVCVGLGGKEGLARKRARWERIRCGGIPNVGVMSFE